MSSTLIRRIAALVVAIAIPFGATASSARAADWSQVPQANVSAGADYGSVGFTSYTPYRSSWS